MTHHLTHYEEELERKAQRRRKRHLPGMRVSGKSVFTIQRIIRSKSRKRSALT